MFKKYWHQRASRKSLIKSLEGKRLDEPFKIKHVRVLLDCTLDINPQYFHDLAKALSIPPVNIMIYAFSSGQDIEKKHAHFFKAEEVTYFGQFEGDLALMCEKEVDLQINYFNRKDLYMEWVSCQTKKKLSAGFSAVNHQLNDIVFDFLPTEMNTFKEELIKYLTILKKL